jgi:hypothetical protein
VTTETPDLPFKRFLGGLALFAGILFSICWIWVIREPMRYHDPDYSVWNAKVSLLDKGDSRLVVLGDSCAEDDILPARFGPGVINLGSAGTTPIDAYFAAKKIAAAKSIPRAVVISFVPFHFINPTPPLFWGRMTFDSLSREDLDEIRQTSRDLNDNALFGNRSPGDIDARLKILLLSLKFPSFDAPALMKTIVASRYRENVEAFNQTLANRGQRYRTVVKESDRLDDNVALKDFVPSKLIDAYFDKTLGLFSAKGIPVYFLGMPHRVLSDQYYAVDLRKNYARYLAGYAARYPNFHVLGDPLPCYPMQYFGDYAHLNADGARVWSDHAVQLLNAAHAEGAPYGTDSPNAVGATAEPATN